MNITKHFSVTTTVVHKNKVLLHFHKKLNLWLPVGGHVDEDELPEEAAVREAREEAGIDIELYNPDKKLELKQTKQLVRPAHMIVHDISEDHKHIDFSFYATTNSFDLKPGDGEAHQLEWFSKEDLEKITIPENARILSLEALDLLGL